MKRNGETKIKEDVIAGVVKRMRSEIDTNERDIYASDVRLIINAFVEECRDIVIGGNPLVIRRLMGIRLEDTLPKILKSQFRGKHISHRIGPSKAVKITPCNSLRDAVREKHGYVVELQQQEKP